MKKLNRIIATIMLLAICFTCIGVQKPTTVEAANKYVSRINFIKMVITEMGIEVKGTSSNDYISKAKEIGLITDKTFYIYTSNISKIDAAIILVRADEFIYGNSTVSDDLVNEIIESRISDINKISKVKRPYLAKAYALGYIKGNSNGSFSTDRTFNPNYKITLTYAKQLVSLINDKDARHTVAPDGQLIRTTNLPKFAKFYPYILASYTNKYYDQEFDFMKVVYNGDLEQPAYGTDSYMKKQYSEFVSPVDFPKYKNGQAVVELDYYGRSKGTASEFYDLHAQELEDKCREHLGLVFNVNYKTISKNNDAWKYSVLNTTKQAGILDGSQMEHLDRYITSMKNNKTIVEFDTIAVDKSTIYVSDGWYYIRAYVKYRVVSGTIPSERKYISPLVFTYYPYPIFSELKLGKWHESYFDIEISLGENGNGVNEAHINDWFNNNRVVIK